LALTRKKDFSIAGFSLEISTDARRADRLRSSPLFRYLVSPGLRMTRRRDAARAVVSEAPPQRPAAAREALSDPAARALAARVAEIGWYHTIDLGHGVVTPGFIDNRSSVPLFGIPDDLTGKRCLDIGTYDGFWAFEMERRGASDVVGIDVDSPLDHDIPRRARLRALRERGEQDDLHRQVWNDQLSSIGIEYPGQGFRLAKEMLGSNARREAVNVYDVSPERLGMFDVVLISQLLLRLRDPQTVIENMFSVARECAIVAEPYDPDLESLDRPVSEFTGTTVMGIWWRHSIKSMRKMMEIAGFDPIEEVSRFEVENRAGRFHKVVLKGHVPRDAHRLQAG
jgi:tRNA (mo5U34)-methyltransferase